MSEKEKNDKMINVDKKSTKNIKMKKIIKKNYKEGTEFWYNDVRKRRFEKFECNNFY